MDDIRHEVTGCCFVAELADERAELHYELDSAVMSITHTRVPFAFRGRGVAAALMAAALTYAHERRLRVIPVCSYAVSYMQRHGAVADQRRQHQEDLLDEALDESFPASDPLAVGGVN